VLVNSGDGTDAAGLSLVAERVRPEVPVVGLAVPVLAPVGADSCFDTLLSKPITRDQLVRAVARFAGGTMLVVDDDRGFVQLVQRLLVSAGLPFEVRWAYDGDEAMQKLKQYRPDVILMDVVMAPMSGTALARLVRADPAMDGTTIIAVTGATATLPAGRARGMQVLKRSGLRDGEALDLLRGVLGQVRADYAATAPSA
jgi:CheY-like chemotaxis protein